MENHLEAVEDPAELLDVVTALVRVLRRSAAASDEHAAGLSLTEFRVLKRLLGGMRLVKELAVDLDVTVPTVSSVVDALVRRELVERCAPEDDRRAVPLLVTDAGQHAAEAARKRQYEALDKILAELETEERTAVARAVSVLSKALPTPAKRGK